MRHFHIVSGLGIFPTLWRRGLEDSIFHVLNRAGAAVVKSAGVDRGRSHTITSHTALGAV
jgi:hypothetical protein